MTEGDQLYLVEGDKRRGGPYYVTITKVGRKYYELSNRERCDKETLVVDRKYGSGARCYLNEFVYLRSVAKETAWHRLKSQLDRMYGNCPTGVSIDDIYTIAALLHINVKEEER